MPGIDALHLGNNLDRTPIGVLNYPLTQDELDILEAAAFIQFGELVNVEITQGEPRYPKPLSPQQKAFIERLRTEKVNFLHTVVVHNGYPQQIEIDGQFGSIQYRRKIRFNQ